MDLDRTEKVMWKILFQQGTHAGMLDFWKVQDRWHAARVLQVACIASVCGLNCLTC